MYVHEHQGKALLKKFNVPVKNGFVVSFPKEIREGVKQLEGGVYVVKAQIHAGGRGKGKFKENPDLGGGVKLAKTVDEAENFARHMLGNVLVTEQTGPEGKLVNKVYIEEGSQIDKEFYLSVLVDRAVSRVVFMVSKEGGVNIEEVAHDHPEKIIMIDIDPVTSIQPFHGRKMAKALGLEGNPAKKLIDFVTKLYQAFITLDANQIEINPLVLTKEGDLIALDAKCNFDDNALSRHANIAAMRDESEEDPLELEAIKNELNYVKMEGTIGCMVNGAGLAMATMDIIKLHGGSPANFLDVGGGATKERVTKAFKIILSDPNVEGILVNIFGGIMRCNIIAEGIIAAAKEVTLNVPLVVRLEGTNVELGKSILQNSGLPILSADNLEDAAQKIVQETNKKRVK